MHEDEVDAGLEKLRKLMDEKGLKAEVERAVDQEKERWLLRVKGIQDGSHGYFNKAVKTVFEDAACLLGHDNGELIASKEGKE